MATLRDLMRHLVTDDFLADAEFAAGAQTWSDTAAAVFGPSAGGLVAAAVKAGFVVSRNDTIELTAKGAEEIARIQHEGECEA